MQKVTISIAREDHERLKDIAEKNYRSLTKQFHIVLEEFGKKNDG